MSEKEATMERRTQGTVPPSLCRGTDGQSPCPLNERDLMPINVHDYDMARMERTVARMWIVILALIICLVGSNLAWTIYENQFQDVVVTQAADALNGGGSNYFNGTGEFNYGSRETEDQDPR